METVRRRRSSIIDSRVSLVLLLFFFLRTEFSIAGAQPASAPNDDQIANQPRFSPALRIILSFLISGFFFMSLASICSRMTPNAARSGGFDGEDASCKANRGLDPSIIEAFPMFSYAEGKDRQIGKGALECAVCLNEYEEGEKLRLLPICDHIFHPQCIGAWLQSHVTCPVCRAKLVPGTGESIKVTNPASGSQEMSNNSDGNVGGIEETVVQVEDNPRELHSGRMQNQPSWTPRSLSIQRPEFKSHSIGHLPVQPGEDVNRFTLKMPVKVKEEVVNRCMLNRARTFPPGLPMEGSSRMAYQTGGGGGEETDRDLKSDRPFLISRGLSISELTAVTASGEDSGRSSATPVKMPSFSCLEVKANEADKGPSVSNASVHGD